MHNPPIITESFVDRVFLIQELVLEDPVHIISAEAFINNPNLISITFKQKVDDIYPGAFKNCYNLESVTFSEPVRKVCANAFANCVALSTINQNGISIIAHDAFSNCALTYFDFSKTDHIQESAFCDNLLETLTITSPITIDKNAFRNNELKTIIVDFNGGVDYLHLNSNAFSGNYKIKDVFYSAPTINLYSFCDTSIENFFLDSKMLELFFFNHTLDEAEIANVFHSGYPELDEPYLSKYAKFADFYKIKDFSFEHLLTTNLPITKINEVLKAKNPIHEIITNSRTIADFMCEEKQ